MTRRAAPADARNSNAPLALALAAPGLGPAHKSDDDRAPSTVPSDPVFTALLIDGSTASGQIRQLGLKEGLVLVKSENPDRAIPIDKLVKLTREGASPPLTSEGGLVVFPDGDRLARSVIGPTGEFNLEIQSFSMGNLAIPPRIDPRPDPEAPDRARRGRRPGDPAPDRAPRGRGPLARQRRQAPRPLRRDERQEVVVPAPPPAGRRARSQRLRGSSRPRASHQGRSTTGGRKGPIWSWTRPSTGRGSGVTDVRIEPRGRLSRRPDSSGRDPAADRGALEGPRGSNASVVYLSDHETVGRSSMDRTSDRPGPTTGGTRASPARYSGWAVGRSTAAWGRKAGHSWRTGRSRGPGDSRWPRLAWTTGPARWATWSSSVMVDKAGELCFVADVPGGAAPGRRRRYLEAHRLLILITEFGERGDVQDHADWVEARIIR